MSKENQKNIDLYVKHYLDPKESIKVGPLRMQIHLEDSKKK
ncbi:hypothetical protein QRE66_01775 [Bacillus cereus]|nr:hypothetical protein QRE66_01775 [Bacillus cereus]